MGTRRLQVPPVQALPSWVGPLSEPRSDSGSSRASDHRSQVSDKEETAEREALQHTEWIQGFKAMGAYCQPAGWKAPLLLHWLRPQALCQARVSLGLYSPPRRRAGNRPSSCESAASER